MFIGIGGNSRCYSLGLSYSYRDDSSRGAVRRRRLLAMRVDRLVRLGRLALLRRRRLVLLGVGRRLALLGVGRRMALLR